jgi:uncharacterized membrane protein YeaQ/YmgE (transglycosylase-associated protein family)
VRADGRAHYSTGMPAALIALILVILFLAFGIGVLGFTLHIFWLLCWYGLMGLIVGGLARLFVPGRQDLGLAATALFGIAGSLLGGVVGREWLGLGFIGEFLCAVAVAAILVLLTARTMRD